jgi:hypothetical protein
MRFAAALRGFPALAWVLGTVVTVVALYIVFLDTPAMRGDWAMQETYAEIREFCDRSQTKGDRVDCAERLRSVIENHDNRRTRQMQGIL